MLSLAIFLPVLGGLFVVALPKSRENLARPIAIGASVVPLVVALVAWLRFDGTQRFEQIEQVNWIPTLGVTYKVGVDGVALPLFAMSALLFLAAIAFPTDLRGRARQYFALFLFLEGISFGVFLALDLFLFYVFFDLSLVGMYFLIAGWGHENSQRAALKFFIYTLTGSLAMLLAIIALYLQTSPRTFDMASIIAQQPLAGDAVRGGLVLLGFSLAFAVKTPIAPLHTWLPPAHVGAPAPASAILAGVLLKMGTFGFVRIVLTMLPEQFQRYAWVFAAFAVFSIVYGALVALAQSNLKRLIAYTSITHMGYAILGIAAAGAVVGVDAVAAQRIALTGAVVEMVAHGLITGAMFLVAGSVWHRAETYEMPEFGGLASRAPRMTGITVVLAFASLGLPGLAGFVAEFQIFTGAFSVFPWAVGFGLLGIVLSAALFLRMVQRMFLGPLPSRWADWRDLDQSELLVLAPLVALTVALGIAPAWLLSVIATAAQISVNR